MLLHAGEKRHLLLGQHLGLLLTHGSTQHVCLAQRIACQDSCGGLHLLLIDDQTIGLIEHLLEGLVELGVDRRNLLQAVLALGVVGVRVHRHRARSVQGNKCGDVVEVIGLERLEQRAHAVGIELEHAERVSARQQLVRLPVIERDLRVVDDALAVVLDVGERVADDRQVGQAEEVHLDQAERFARMVLERGGDGAVGALQQRRGVGDRRGTHDRGARVDSGLANQPLDALRLLGDALDFGIGVVQLAVFARLGVALGARVEDVVHADVLASGGGRRQRLGDTSAHLKGESHDARGVLERLLGLDGAVDHALGDLVMAVLVGHIAQHAHAAFGIEVDVDIGQGHTPCSFAQLM